RGHDVHHLRVECEHPRVGARRRDRRGAGNATARGPYDAGLGLRGHKSRLGTDYRAVPAHADDPAPARRLALGRNEPVVEGEHDGRSAVAEAELREDVPDVALDRYLAD